MHSKLIHKAAGQRTYAIIFETGDEVIAGLKQVAQEQQLGAAGFTAIGAFRDVTVAWFDFDAREYRNIPIREQVEVLALTGDVSEDADGKPKVHAHVVLGKSDGTTRGGHLMEGHVRPTLEVILTESPAHLRRQLDATSGLALIHL